MKPKNLAGWVVAKPDRCPRGTDRCRVFLLKNLNFFKIFVDKRKNLWYNIRVAGGIPAKGTNVAPLRGRLATL